MRLIPGWQGVLRRAWSIKFMLAAGLFTGLEFVLPYIHDFFPLDRGVFAALGFIATAGGLVSRLIAQRQTHEAADIDWGSGQ